jgi:hypothetical protein
MPTQITINTWLLQENLSLFLERVSALVGYGFEGWDWDALRFGVRDTDIKQDRWYEYTLSGNPPVELAFAGAEDAKRLHVKVESEDRTAVRIEALARIMQCYEEALGTQDLEMLIEAAFLETHLPDQDKLVACDAAHLARCPECQEVLAFFGGKHWRTLLREEVPLPSALGGFYAGLGLLTLEAQRFFFPAYLVTAIRDKDKDLVENALERVGQEHCTPLQQELIEFARHLLQTGVA